MVWTWEGRDLSHAMCSPREFDMRRMQFFSCHMFTLIVRKMQSFPWFVFTLLVWTWEGRDLAHAMCLPREFGMRRMQSFPCHMFTLIVRKMQSFPWYVFTLMIWARERRALSRVMWFALIFEWLPWWFEYEKDAIFLMLHDNFDDLNMRGMYLSHILW